MIKRSLDIFMSLIVLILLFPFLFLVSMLIVFESKGGVFYKQIRVGLNGVDFKLLKFRSMKVGSDSKGLLTVGNDSRITKIGQFIRKFKIDEFPQLINIIKGDMSIVGPRPEVRKYVSLYNEEQAKVLCVRPGLTDYASIEYLNESEELAKSEDPEKLYIEKIMPHKIQLNLEYINRKSLIVDLKIIFTTIFKIFK